MGTTQHMTKNLGGDRLGSGAKMNVDFHAYNRSNHDLSHAWRSSMNAGTLVPFLKLVALNGDTFSIDIETLVRTIPAVSPLYGSYKLQADIFLCPVRLYNGLLHNNMLNIGMNMKQVKLPKITLTHILKNPEKYQYEIENSQIASDALLHYLGKSGIGDAIFDNKQDSIALERKFPAVDILAYYDIYKNYYANKQEGTGAYIAPNATAGSTNIINIVSREYLRGTILEQQVMTMRLPIDSTPDAGITTDTYQEGITPIKLLQQHYYYMRVPKDFDVSTAEIQYKENGNTQVTTLELMFPEMVRPENSQDIELGRPAYYETYSDTYELIGIGYNAQAFYESAIQIRKFPLQNIDDARIAILQNTGLGNEFSVNTLSVPYASLHSYDGAGASLNSYHQCGLAIKTYQSDLLNNWLNTEWIEGVNGITELTKVDTSSGSFAIDALNLAKKIYNMYNRIAAGGGSYEDWQEAVYSVEANRRAESPIYMGGTSSEIVFEEVVSQSATEEDPLGTMAGKGTQSNKRGGHVEIKVTEPSYIIGICSITPRVDYSQGNDWEVELDTLDDLHKPALDGIGFEDLLQERGAWWGTYWDETNQTWVKKAIGKVPAWINYMTANNKTHGTFAEPNKTMVMTLNRRYEYRDRRAISPNRMGIKDLTTYVNPTKYNYTFADSSLAAQNFWVQIGMRIEARRVMSAKQIPTM